MKKRIFSIIIIVSLCLSLVSFDAFAAPTVKVFLDDDYIIFDDVDPTIVNGRTMVPFRKILEEIGAVVTYDSSTKIIGASLRDTTLSFKAGSSVLSVTKNDKTTMKQMDAPPVLTASGRVLVPIRHILESLDLHVSWDSASKTVIIVDIPAVIDKYIGDYSVLITLEKAAYSGNHFKRAGSAKYLMEISSMDTSDKITALSVDGNFDVISSGPNYSGTIKSSVIFPVPGLNTGDIMQSTDNLIYDSESATLFIKPKNNVAFMSEAFPGFDENTYIRINESALWSHVFPEALSERLISLLSFDGHLSVRSFLTEVFASACSGFDSLEKIAFTNEVYKNIVGDAMFYREKTGGNNEKISLSLYASDFLSAYESACLKFPSLDYAAEELERAKELYFNYRAVTITGQYEIYAGALSFSLDAASFASNLTDARVQTRLYKTGGRYYNYLSKIYMGEHIATYTGVKNYESTPLQSADITTPPLKFKALDLMDIFAIVGA